MRTRVHGAQTWLSLSIMPRTLDPLTGCAPNSSTLRILKAAGSRKRTQMTDVLYSIIPVQGHWYLEHLWQVMTILHNYTHRCIHSYGQFSSLQPTWAACFWTVEEIRIFGWNPRNMQTPHQNSSRPPAVPNRSNISTCTSRHFITFISAGPLRAPPGWNCPIYSFNLALRVRAVSCGPISDDLQVHMYDLMSRTLNTTKWRAFLLRFY